MITLPLYTWFEQNNIFLGSVREYPEKSTTTQHSLNFRIYMEYEDYTPKGFVVETYWQAPWKDDFKKSETQTQTFPAGAESLESIKAHILEKFQNGPQY